MKPIILARFFAFTIFHDVHFTTHDRLHAGRFAFLIKLNRAVHHAVIGQSHGRHAVRFHFINQIADLGQTVEQGVVAVDV